MNIKFKIFLLGLIIIVTFFLIRKHSLILENFYTESLTPTNTGLQCIKWKDAVQFREYGDSNKCKNPTNDINGSWCYTDTHGNFDYCDSYNPGCHRNKILEGCFTPDPDKYEMVISNKQPFEENYLEIDKIVDSTNKIWCLDQSGRFLRNANKSDYINYQWNDIVNDSLNGYDYVNKPDEFFIISGFGVKKGGYTDTRKNNKNEEQTSLVASEVCYLFLKNSNENENKMMRCFSSEQINIHNSNNKIDISFADDDRSTPINLGKKIMIDKKGYIFGIQREKIKNDGKFTGLYWGDIVIGKENDDGKEIKFNIFAETKTLPDILNETITDLDNTEETFFKRDILKFVNKYSYLLNDAIQQNDTENLDKIISILNGSTNEDADTTEAEHIKQFQNYLKYRTLIDKTPTALTATAAAAAAVPDLTELVTPITIEKAEEILKIMGEISNRVINDGVDLGVIDFNLTDKYLYIDYVYPDSTDFLKIGSVRLSKEYIDYVYEKNASFKDIAKLKNLRYFKDDDQTIENTEHTISDKTLTLDATDLPNTIDVLNIDDVLNYKTENNGDYNSLINENIFYYIKTEINKHTFLEQGKICVKKKKDTDNLNIYLKTYEANETYEDNVKKIKADTYTGDSSKIRTFYDPDEKDLNGFLNIKPESLTGATSIYGLLKNSLQIAIDDAPTENARDAAKKTLTDSLGDAKVPSKQIVFFQLYGKKKVNANTTDEQSGPINLINQTNLAFSVTPDIKYTHGLIYTEDGKINIVKENYGLLYWFYLQQKGGKFVNVSEWLKYYKTLKVEGLYNIGASKVLTKEIPFNKQFEAYKNSLESKPEIGSLTNDDLKKLVELETFVYDKEETLEKEYPQLNLHILKSKKFSNQVFVEIIAKDTDKDKDKDTDTDKDKDTDKDNVNDINGKDVEIITLVLDKETNSENYNRTEDSKFKNKYGTNSNPFQDKKDGKAFDYEYYKLVKKNKFELLADSDFCQDAENKNTHDSLWRFKIIDNFDDYKSIVEPDAEGPIKRNKGLFEINNIYRDEEYYTEIGKHTDSNNEIIKKTSEKILIEKKKNMLAGTGYPFMVIYQVRDYTGLPCLEGDKDSQKIFLTFNLNNLIEYEKVGPIISEEFISYTGLGGLIRFGYQKAPGETPLAINNVCSTNIDDALPGYSDDCGKGTNCDKKVVGMTRLDGTSQCSFEDKSVKTKSVTALEVLVPGNVALNDCDIYKMKGNKKVKYTLGKIFGYNDSGKYTLKNQYTLKYENFYFKYKQNSKNPIQFVEEFNNHPDIISSYSFNLTYGEDNYGVYILLSPQLGPAGENAIYLTRVINIFDKHFDQWALEKRIDMVQDKNNNYIRNGDDKGKIVGKTDLDFYSQKFNLPEDAILKIATEEGIKTELLEKMRSDMEKNNSVFCNVGGQGESSVCKGDFNSKPEITLDEENAILQKQSTQVNNLMKRFENIPTSHFTNFPQNQELHKFMKATINDIQVANEFIYKRIKDVNWVVTTQMEVNEEVNQFAGRKKKSSNKINNKPMDNLIDEQGIMAEALKSLGIAEFGKTNPADNRQCKSLEGFGNIVEGFGNVPSSSDGLNKNISGKYYNYIKEQIDEKKNHISDLNDKIHNLLSGLNKMSGGFDMTGEKKQMLLSEMVQERNKLEQMMFDIKNYEQQDRITNINKKLAKVEKIRSELDEDDFRTKKSSDDANNISIISREDGEFLNMYKIDNKKEADHLLFVNGGCLDYSPEKKDIKVSHCMADKSTQKFNIHRIEDKKDMENYKLKNSENGLEKSFDIIKTKDGKCLHKEEGELSFRNCDNVKNQYWDYSNITGPCNMK